MKKRHEVGMAHKTKAAMLGRSCQCTKLKRVQNTMLIDQVNDCNHSASGCLSCRDCLRWRRLISPFTAVTINCAFVSPISRLFSNSATTSCGNRAFSCCDLLLTEPVAITESPYNRCDSVYAKKMIIKGLRCDSLNSIFNREGAIHLVSAKPGCATTQTGPLTTIR
ncbi:hypothetical protein Dda3937_04442 [Dickeya dadantii 3937]|uniref:Uncharacterized protein n=1 Tax=Dickeya dadantii (strain 3937) TaxID=198628 RepID=E0SH84_DICD3|nr:hypothetical protein Dda3937_04442 [Dickeya dadantii 3937]